MYVRLAFAVAAHLEPEILLVDEVLAVGDAEFQRKCLGRMEDVSSARAGRSSSSRTTCGGRPALRPRDPARGRPTMDGPGRDVVAHYLQMESGVGLRHGLGPTGDPPGDDLVRLRSVRLVEKDGRGRRGRRCPPPIGIEIAFDVLRHGDAVFPKIKLVDSGGDVAFNALDTREQWSEPSAPGEYVSTAWIPGNLLSEVSTRST